MPLDTSEFAVSQTGVPARDDLAPLRPTPVTLNSGTNLGAALREARESLGLTVEDIALATRVRGAHLGAIEAFDLDSLPARPFAIGYVRAYARALGLDGEAVVARFRAEAPRLDGALRAPGGVRRAPRRLGLLGDAALLILASVLAWNFVRHAKAPTARQTLSAPSSVALRPDGGPARLGAPLPPPPEAASPPAYETPGLGVGPSTPILAGDVIGSAFIAAGAVYGAPGPVSGPNSGILLQAKKPTSLIVRGPGGAVYFARQLAAGEAWRAPTLVGLTIDVSNPASVEVFQGGLARGPLTAAQTPLARIAD